MFGINYEKKLKKLIIKKTKEKDLLQEMLNVYSENNNIGDKQRERIENVITGYTKELILCKTEMIYNKETYKKHKEEFNNVIRIYM